MTNRQLGVGVIGYGYWGPNLVRNFSNGISTHVVSICDLDPGKLATSQRLYPGVTTTSDFHDLLTNPAIDAVVLSAAKLFLYGMTVGMIHLVRMTAPRQKGKKGGDPPARGNREP